MDFDNSQYNEIVRPIIFPILGGLKKLGLAGAIGTHVFTVQQVVHWQGSTTIQMLFTEVPTAITSAGWSAAINGVPTTLTFVPTPGEIAKFYLGDTTVLGDVVHIFYDPDTGDTLGRDGQQCNRIEWRLAYSTIGEEGYAWAAAGSLLELTDGGSTDPDKHILQAQYLGAGEPGFITPPGLYNPDLEKLYREIDENTPPWYGARKVTNTCIKSEDIVNWSTIARVDIETDAPDPDGGNTAFTITATEDTGIVRQLIVDVPSGNTNRVSLWIRRRSGIGAVALYGGASTGNQDVAPLITNEWRRLAIDTATATGTDQIGFIISVAGDSIDVWHPQNEDVTGQTNQNPSEYIKTFSEPVTQYFDNLNGTTVDPVTGVVIGGGESEMRYVENTINQSEDLTSGWIEAGNLTIDTETTVSSTASSVSDRILRDDIDPSRFVLGDVINVSFTAQLLSGATVGQIRIIHPGKTLNFSRSFTGDALRYSFELTLTSEPLGTYFSIYPSFGDGGGYSLVITDIQIEKVTGHANQNPGEYVPSTDEPVTEAFNYENGNTVDPATNVVTEAQGAPYPVNPEGAMITNPVRKVTNLCLGSYEMDGSSFFMTAAAIAGGVADPIGGNSAYTLSATGDYGRLRSNTDIPAGRNKLQSVWLRRRTGTGGVILINGDTTSTTTLPLTATWQRFSDDGIPSTGAIFSDEFVIQLRIGGDEVDIWHPQVEDSSNYPDPTIPSEYVPTGASPNGQLFTYANGNTVGGNYDGPDLTVDGDFTSDTGAWDRGINWNILSGGASHTGMQGVLSQLGLLEVGKEYHLRFFVTYSTSGSTLTPIIGGVRGTTLSNPASGEYEFYAVAGDADYGFEGLDSVTIDNVSIKEQIPGAGEPNVVHEQKGLAYPLNPPSLFGNAAVENSIPYSSDLTNAAWLETGTDVAALDAVGMRGEANGATTLTDDDVSSTESVYEDETIPADTNTNVMRCWIKKDTDETRFPLIQLRFIGGGSIYEGIHLNTKTGAVSETQTSGEYEVNDDGLWWEVLLSMANDGARITCRPLIRPADGTVIGTGNVAATGSIIVGNVELHLNATISRIAGSQPIFTEGSAVSQAAIEMPYDIANHSDVQGAYYCETQLFIGGIECVSHINMVGLGDITNILYMGYGHHGRSRTFDGTNVTSPTSHPPTIAEEFYRYATIYDSSEPLMSCQIESDRSVDVAFDGDYGNAPFVIGPGSTYPMLIRNVRRYNLPYAESKIKIDQLMGSDGLFADVLGTFNADVGVGTQFDAGADLRIDNDTPVYAFGTYGPDTWGLKVGATGSDQIEFDTEVVVSIERLPPARLYWDPVGRMYTGPAEYNLLDKMAPYIGVGVRCFVERVIAPAPATRIQDMTMTVGKKGGRRGYERDEYGLINPDMTADGNRVMDFSIRASNSKVRLIVEGEYPQDEFTEITVNGGSLPSADAVYLFDGLETSWTWSATGFTWTDGDNYTVEVT